MTKRKCKWCKEEDEEGLFNLFDGCCCYACNYNLRHGKKLEVI